MNKKIIVLCILIPLAALFLKFLWKGISGIKVDEFKPVAAIFLIDVSASNQSLLHKQKQYLLGLCKRLDPEDKVKILTVSQDANLMYEGTPHAAGVINKMLNKYSAYDAKAYGTAYGTAMKKGVNLALSMTKEGYTPAIIVLGDLENEGAIEGQINWSLLPKNIQKAKQYMPDLSLAFMFAHPSKLDLVKEKLGPVMGENKLTIASEENADKNVSKILKAMGR